MFDNARKLVYFDQISRGVYKMPSIAEKRLLRKKYKKHWLSSVQKTNSGQTTVSVFTKRVEVVEWTKFELNLLKIIGCSLKSHGNDDSNLLSLRMNFL